MGKIDWRKAYSKERSRLLKPFSKLRKEGFEPQADLPILKELDKRNLSSKDFKKLTLKLRKIKGKDVAKQEAFDISTGEILTIKQAREKIKHEKTYPTIGALHAVLSKLDELPAAKLVYSKTAKKLFWVDIDSKTSVLYKIVQDLISEYGEQEVDRIYYKNQEEIFNLLDEIPPASQEEDIQQSFVNLAYYLSGGQSLSMQEAEDLADMGSYYENA